MTEYQANKLNEQYEYCQNKLINLYRQKDKLVTKKCQFRDEERRRDEELKAIESSINDCSLELYKLYEAVERIKKAGLSKQHSDPAINININYYTYSGR